MNAALSQEARKAIAALQLIIQLEEITIPTACRLLKKSPKWVRENLPIIVHSHKNRHVRLADVEAFQLKRTIWPTGTEFPMGRSPGKEFPKKAA